MSEPSKNPQKNTRENAAPLLGCYDDLDGSCAHAWALLARGVKDRRSPFHTPALATVTQDGLPEIRTVVLRGCDSHARNLRFHTDTRSGKIAELNDNPFAAMHFYDAGAKIQLRVRARLELLTGEAMQARGTIRAHEPRMLSGDTGARLPLSTPADVVFDAAATNDGADHFAPVVAHVRQIEWLYLAARGHRRALFDFTASEPQHSWLVP